MTGSCQAVRARERLPPCRVRQDQGCDPGIYLALVVAGEDGHNRHLPITKLMQVNPLCWKCAVPQGVEFVTVLDVNADLTTREYRRAESTGGYCGVQCKNRRRAQKAFRVTSALSLACPKVPIRLIGALLL
jgi:hypothetical protein